MWSGSSIWNVSVGFPAQGHQVNPVTIPSLLSQVIKLKAQVFSCLGATFSKELHFGVYFACPLTCPAQTRNFNKTLLQLYAHNFPTPQVKHQGQFNWNWHKFRQINIILSMIKKTPFLFMEEDN